jgi:hypothetical protein
MDGARNGTERRTRRVCASQGPERLIFPMGPFFLRSGGGEKGSGKCLVLRC